METWLERSDGRREEVDPNCFIGRAAGSSVRIDSVQVSRRHAQIHAQQAESGIEYWIADLGSMNGTIRNGRRVTVPSRLHDGDRLLIGDELLVFHMEQQGRRMPTRETEGAATILVEGRRICWLLMVDIKGYTSLSQRLPEDELGRLVGGWFLSTRDAIEGAGGIVDKLLGDAVFAYWEDGPDTPARVARALRELMHLQRARTPDFRIITHRGPVLLQGGAGGANNLSGLEVIFVFRMEKVCAALGCDTLVSTSAKKVLEPLLATFPLGEHPLDGFGGRHALFGLAQDPDITRSGA